MTGSSRGPTKRGQVPLPASACPPPPLFSSQIEGQGSRRLDVTCKVVESRVDVIGMDVSPGVSISAIDFGTCYFGQTRTQRVKLTNQSPFLVSWHMNSPDMSDALDDEGEETLPIACVPGEGRLGAYGSSVLEFQFSPVFREKRKGFARTAKKAAELSGVWKNTYVVDILETEQKLELMLSGKAVQPDVAFSETVFKFGECDVNDHRDIIFQVLWARGLGAGRAWLGLIGLRSGWGRVKEGTVGFDCIRLR